MTHIYWIDARIYCQTCNAQLVRNPGTSTIKTVHPADNKVHLAHS